MDYFAYLNSSISLVLVFALCIFYLHRKSRESNSKIHPPKVAGGWPVIGHLPLLSGRELPHVVLGALADKYGSIYRIRLGMQSTVVVSSSDLAKELFTKDMAAASRPKLVAAKIMGYNNAMFAFVPNRQYWREVRKMVTLELLSSSAIELQKHIRRVEVEAWLKELHNLWSNTRRIDGSGHVLVDMSKWFEDLMMNVILRTVVGKRSFGTGAEGDEEEARRCQKATKEMMRLLGVFAMRDAVPFLGWLDLGGHEKAMKKVAKEWDDLLSQWLEEHKMMKGAKDQEKDFMDAMLSLLDEGTNIGGFDTDVINKATCLTIIVAASDTTSTTLTWAIALLLNNRDALRKVREELDIKVGKGRMVQESDITSLVYLQAVVKETMRLYPAGPLSLPREVIEDFSMGGYHVPKGTRLIMNLWKIQTDPEIWAEPFRFKPERFFETHKHVDVRGRHYELIPFGGGRRVCPGVSSAMQLIPFVLASFVHAFELSTPSDALVDMTASVAQTIAKATPLEVIISPHLSSEIYKSC